MHVHQTVPQNVSRQRPAPVLELRKNGVVVATSATGYIRDANDHEESSNTIFWIDANPDGSAYTVTGRVESTQAGDVNSVTGQFFARSVVTL